MSQIQLIRVEITALKLKGKSTEKPQFPQEIGGGRYWIRTSDTRLVRPVLFR